MLCTPSALPRATALIPAYVSDTLLPETISTRL